MVFYAALLLHVRAHDVGCGGPAQIGEVGILDGTILHLRCVCSRGGGGSPTIRTAEDDSAEGKHHQQQP